MPAGSQVTRADAGGMPNGPDTPRTGSPAPDAPPAPGSGPDRAEPHPTANGGNGVMGHAADADAGRAGSPAGTDNDASPPVAGPQGSEPQDADDYEPYLPPGPNPFSSVHPQGTPLYGPLSGRNYPDDRGQKVWPRDPAESGQGYLTNGRSEQQYPNGGGAEPGPAPAMPWASAWQGGPSGGLGPAEPGASGAGENTSAERYGQPPGRAAGPASSAFPAPGYPHASPYPPLPESDPGGNHPSAPAEPGGRSGQDSYGGASAYPAYDPYGPAGEASDAALMDYGLPSPQSYQYAPPPPPVEPMPGLGVPELGYDSEPPRESDAPPQYDPQRAYEEAVQRGYDPDPLRHYEQVRDDEARPSPADREARQAGGHRRSEEPPGHGDWREPAPDGGLQGIGLGGAASAGAPPAREAPPAPGGRVQPGPVPPGLAQAGRALPASAQPGAGSPAGGQGPVRPAPGGQPGPQRGAPQRGGPQPGGPQPGRPQPGMRPGGPSQPGAPAGLRGDELSPLPPAQAEAERERETADSLTAEALLHGKRAAPGSGWRRTLFKATGGLVHVGESASEQRRRELMWRARTPVAGGHHRVAVMSLKGGVGKTTTTVGLGATLATLRGDRVIAVDGNPDRGTLSDKVRLETAATVRDLLNERGQVRRYADVRAFTSQAPSRLEVLASDRDPTVSVAFSEADYRDVAQVLEHYYSICITDCGTGLLHSAMSGILRLADQIVLVSSPSVDGARSASATLDWLDAHDYGDLVRNAVVVLSTVRPRSKSTVDLDRLEQHFAARCRSVVRIPYDPHLEEGAEVELEQLSPATTDAYLQLAATVGDGFAWPRRAGRRQPSVQP
jgi:MinD-like ATPase involved in chromosome partitioning or flagellar assembly